MEGEYDEVGDANGWEIVIGFQMGGESGG